MTPAYTPPSLYSPAASQKRIVLVGAGDTGGDALLETGQLFQRLPSERKTFIWFNTHLKTNDLDPALLPQGIVLATPIPRWPTEAVSGERFDDHAAERPFLREDRPFMASLQGAEDRHEGALACIASRDDLYRALIDAVSRVGSRNGNEVVTVELVIAAFAGRGTGSGGLPVIIGMIEPLRAAFDGQVNLVVTIAAQLPTVRVEDLKLYRVRSATLLAEITGLAEEQLATDPDRSTGGWRNRLPWDDFLLFSTGGGRAVQPRGVVTDISESARYMAAVLYERLAGEVSGELAAQAPNRARVLMDRDDGTDLPRMFSATGIAELVYEPAAAVEHGTAYLERALYEAVRTKHDQRT